MMTTATAVLPGPGLLRRYRGVWAAAASALVLCLLYLLSVPPVPDLAAQVARTDLVRASGNVVWWAGWFAGLHTPTYSELGPEVMAVLTPPVAGALATVAASVLMGLLLQSSRRPVAGALAFAVAAFADLLDGRVAFALGVAVAVAALVALHRRRTAWAAVAAVLTTLFSPLATLFLLIAALAVALAVPSRRREAVVTGAAGAATGAGLALLFPGVGRMPYSVGDLTAPMLICLTLVVVLRQRLLRIGAAIVAAALAGFLVLPGAVGENVTRIVWLMAVPLVVAFGPWRRWAAVALAAGLAVWPAVDLATQLGDATDPSTQAAYYQPLVRELGVAVAAAGRAAGGERVEVVDPRTHWETVYVAAHYPIARGWDRQADAALNPLFYRPGLTAATYREWLADNAVGWVAMPAAPLDYASVAEGRLVRAGLPYLRRVWSGHAWVLYRVVGASRLVSAGQVLHSTPTGVELRLPGGEPVRVRLHYSPYLVLRPLGVSQPDGCVRSAGTWTQVSAPAAGVYWLRSAVGAAVAGGSADGCAGVPAPAVSRG